MGGQTLGTYIVHVTILALLDSDHLNWVIDAQGHLWGNFLELAGFIVLTLFTMLLVWLFNQWKWTRILILGQKG